MGKKSMGWLPFYQINSPYASKEIHQEVRDEDIRLRHICYPLRPQLHHEL